MHVAMKITSGIFALISFFLSGCASVVEISNCSLPQEDTWSEVSSSSARLAVYFSNTNIKQRGKAIWFINNSNTKVYACGLAVGKTPACGSQNNIYVKNQGVVSKEYLEIVVCSSSAY